MQLGPINPGDVIRADVGGRTFLAFVDGRDGDHLNITPESSGVTFRQVKARQITGHYRRSRQSKDIIGKGLA